MMAAMKSPATDAKEPIAELLQRARAARDGSDSVHGRDLAQLAWALTALGACFERMGDPWQAERLMDDAMRLAHELDDPFAKLVALNNLCAVCIGAFYVLRGGDEPAEAIAALRRALAHAREAHSLLPHFSDPFFSVFVEGNLG